MQAGAFAGLDGLPLQRRLVWWLTLGAVVLLLGSVTGFLWHERRQELAAEASLSRRRVARLADELSQALRVAQVAIAQAEARLQRQPAGASLPALMGGAQPELAGLLAALPLPFELRALDASGRSIDRVDASLGGGGAQGQPGPSPAAAGTGWVVEATQGVAGARWLLRRAAAPNVHGVAAFSVRFDPAALLARLEGSRMPQGGVAALFCIEPDGSTSALVRAPNDEAEPGRRKRGPLALALERSPRGMFEDKTEPDARHRSFAYQRLDGDAATLVVAYGMASDAVLADWHRQLPWVALVTLLLSGALLEGGRRLDRSIRSMLLGRQALQRSESHFRALADNLPDAVVRLDAQGRHLYANASVERATGLPPAAFIGKTNAELGMPAQVVARWMDTLARVFERGGAQQVEFAYPGPAGLRHWESLVALEPPVPGEPPTALVISRDITERVTAGQAVLASEARLAYLLRSAPTVIYTASTSGDYGATYYSPNLNAMLGWQPERFLEEPGFWLEHVHPDDRDAVLAQMDGLHERGELVLEYRFQHADGSWRWMRDAVRLERAADGTPTELVGSWIDITARREAEGEVRRLAADLEQRVRERTAELARSEARLRRIFETVPVSIGEEDWSGVQQLLRELRASGVTDGASYFAAHPDFVQRCLAAVRVLRLNRKALSLHDANDKGSDLSDLKAFYPSPEDLPQFVGEIEALWQGRRLYTAKKSLPSITGRPLQLMMTMSLPALDDDDGLVLVCLVDISEVDRLNAELELSLARLRQANQELETFTYSVSHDLKAPLRGIDGYSRLLLADHQAQLDDEGRQFLGHIRQATQHMGVLIDDLLAYSRMERRELTLARLALAPLVDAVLATYQHGGLPEGVELLVELAPDLHAHADAQGLTIALRNLLDNALKFSRDSLPPRIRIVGTRGSGRVQLAVQDNGLGFDIKFHDRIFAIFQRLHRAEDHPGTGVGLAIVRKAMQRMGGRVWAQSQPGQGATFTLELPEAA